MKKRTLSLLLISALLLASCGGTSAGNDETTTAASDESTSGDVTTAAEYKPETVDYKEHEFKILYKDWGAGHSWQIFDVDADVETGESINDAVYDRNRTIEEEFNVKITGFPVTDALNAFRNDVTAGDATYDAFQYGISELATEAVNDMLVDLLTLDGFHFEEAWWDNMMMESISANGKAFFALGDINLNDNKAAWSILFNKKIRDDYDGLSDYYAAVESGKWTLDLLHKDAKTAADDLNGDQKMHWEDDRYGMIGQYRIAPALLAAAGHMPITRNSDGSFTYNLGKEQLIDAFGVVYDLINDDTCIRMYENADINNWAGTAKEPFMSGKALFFMTPIATVTDIRDMNDDFGILPIPKLDEAQESYQSIIQYNNGTAYAIPNNGCDPERAAVILDAMAFYSKEHLTPAYYDITLQRKSSRDDESENVLDLIFSSGVFDYSQAFGGIGITDFIMNTCKGENNFASGEASNRDSFLAKIDQLIK